jgi:hypothetical protein
VQILLGEQPQLLTIVASKPNQILPLRAVNTDAITTVSDHLRVQGNQLPPSLIKFRLA